MGEVFEYRGKTLECARNPGERAIEIPIARDWLSHLDPEARCNLIEIGAVTPYWTQDGIAIENEWTTEPYDGAMAHAIYDPHDRYPRCIRSSVAEDRARMAGADVLCISTIEHIGTGEYGPTDSLEAQSLLTQILELSRSHLITWPLGHNRGLDAHLVRYAADIDGLYVYERTTSDGGWRKVDPPHFDFEYGSPLPYGNGIVFIERRVEI